MSKFKIQSFFGRLMLSHFIVILISLIAIGIIFGYLVQNFFFGMAEWEAISGGRRIANQVEEDIEGGRIDTSNIEQVQNKIDTIARYKNMDIALMDHEGQIIVTSSTVSGFNIELEEEEVAHVLDGNVFTRKMMGPEQNDLLMLVPLFEEGQNEGIMETGPQPEEDVRVIGGIITGAPLGDLGMTANRITHLLLYSLLIALIPAAALSLSFTRWVVGPLNKLKDYALDIAKGQFKQVEIPEKSSFELHQLGNTFNYAVRQIKDTIEKQKRLESLRKRFVENISHEFRAPLTSIKGFLELMVEGELQDEEMDDFMQIMQKDIDYLERLLSDLNDLEKLEADNYKLNKELIHPEEIIERAVNSIRVEMESKNIELELNIDDELLPVEMDPYRIHQVLINLLRNAVNYSPEDSVIELTADYFKNSDGQDKVRFSIIDEGPGIPEDEQDKIWERFYKIDRARTRNEKKGSGLGLAIVKDIILRHDGEIRVNNEPQKGARFSFILDAVGALEKRDV